ncbi:erythromycin esterase family protein [Ferruginibacter sp.]|nr:erythromycin esterase family protein [Ferruginibacter sp.]
MDSPNGKQGEETVEFTSVIGGYMILKVKAFDDTVYNPKSGKYTIEYVKHLSADEYRIYLKQNQAAFTKRINWLNNRLHLIKNTGAGKGHRDIKELGVMINRAAIVGIGEPTHGTYEAFSFKFNLLRYLVEEKGFNAFVLEEDMASTALINNYIVSNSNEPAVNVLKRNTKAVWHNKELVRVIEWMKDYNSGHSQKIKFWGVDMQSDSAAINAITQFARKYDTTLYASVNRINEIREKRNRRRMQGTMAQKDTTDVVLVKKLLKDLSDVYTARYSFYESICSKDTVIWIKHAIELLRQFSLYSALNFSGKYRDSCMATNVKWIIENYPETKMLLSQHNFHISNKPVSMGNQLKTFYVQNYFTIAITTSGGTYSGFDQKERKWGSWPLLKPNTESYEYYFAGARAPLYYLQLNNIPIDEPLADWITVAKTFREIGFARTTSQFFTYDLIHDFDAVIFIKNSRAVQRN